MSKDIGIDKRTRRALARAVRVKPPRGLLRRLLSIPGQSAPTRARGAWHWVAAPAALAGVAALAFLLAPLLDEPEPSPEELAAAAAMRDFTVAMAYLQRSAEIADRHTRDQIGDGLYEALVLSRDALSKSDTNNGG